jgi:gamma-glutamyltranspeptidase / glutathione hydrolase
MVVPGYGFLLNNELTDFNLGADGTSPRGANQVAGRKRPRSSIAPTIVLRDRRPFLAVGSPGGATIITTVLQILVNRLDFGDTLPLAIAAPRASQRNAATTDVEQAFLAQGPLVQSLTARREKFAAPAEIGAATGIEFRSDGRMLAAAEPVRRGGGSAMVVRRG